MLKRCSNGHYYDSSQAVSCPFCSQGSAERAKISLRDFLARLSVGSFLVGSGLCAFGSWLVSQGNNGDVEISFWGQTLKSSNLGFAMVFVGATLIIVNFRRLLDSYDRMLAVDSTENPAQIEKSAPNLELPPPNPELPRQQRPSVSQTTEPSTKEVPTEEITELGESAYTGPRRNQVSIGREAGLGEIKVIECLRRTKYSIVEEILLDSQRYVLKRTAKALCDVNCLRQLEGLEITAASSGLRLSVATPIKVWEEKDWVLELHNYYSGQSFRDLLLRNKYRLKAELLGCIYDAGMQALLRLHRQGILHRDLTPNNLFLLRGGDVVFLDVSFCCFENGPQSPVFSKNYSPPEQVEGKALKQSDWYTFASTIFFLANGHAPKPSDQESFNFGLSQIDIGDYSYTHLDYGGSEDLFRSLLEPTISARPSDYGYVLPRVGTSISVNGLEGVINLGHELGYLIMQTQQYGVIPETEEARAVLQDVLDGTFRFLVDRKAIGERKAFETIEIPGELAADVRNFIVGGDPWTTKGRQSDIGC